jgi:Yip1-like protein
MTETTSTPPSPAPPPGLLARLIGVLFSPRETFAAVVARPRWLGAMAVAVVIMSAAQFALLSTDVGKQLALDQQVSTIEAFGVTITDEVYARMEQGMENARYTGPISLIIGLPLVAAISAGILHVMFGLVGGGNGTYKQVYAISSHTAIVNGLQLVFTTIVTLAAGRAAGANLSVFTPTLEETTFGYRFLSAIDLFYVWSTFLTAVGLGVLYKRRTGPIAMVLLGIYLVIALIIGYVRSGS